MCLHVAHAAEIHAFNKIVGFVWMIGFHCGFLAMSIWCTKAKYTRNEYKSEIKSKGKQFIAH